jgi:hypothetical protein
MVSIIDQPESHSQVQQFVEYWTPLVDRVIVRPYLENLGLTPRKPGTVVDQEEKLPRWPCPQFWKRVTISAEGHLRFCVVDTLDTSVVGHLRTDTIQGLWQGAEYARLRAAHLEGRFGDAHSLCAPCTDWMGMRWDWGFEVAVRAVTGRAQAPSTPPMLRTY